MKSTFKELEEAAEKAETIGEKHLSDRELDKLLREDLPTNIGTLGGIIESRERVAETLISWLFVAFGIGALAMLYFTQEATLRAKSAEEERKAAEEESKTAK